MAVWLLVIVEMLLIAVNWVQFASLLTLYGSASANCCKNAAYCSQLGLIDHQVYMSCCSWMEERMFIVDGEFYLQVAIESYGDEQLFL